MSTFDLPITCGRQMTADARTPVAREAQVREGLLRVGRGLLAQRRRDEAAGDLRAGSTSRRRGPYRRLLARRSPSGAADGQGSGRGGRPAQLRVRRQH